MVEGIEKQVKGMVKGNDQDALNQNKAILDRIARILKADTDAAVAKVLGLKPQNIVSWKKKGVPDKWIWYISKKYECSVNFLLHGEEEDDEGTVSKNGDKNFEDDLSLVSEKPDLGSEVNLLAEILKSGDNSIIQALHSNLVAFKDAVQSTGSLAKLKKENEDLKNEIKRLNIRLEQSRIQNLERRLESIERLYLSQLKEDPYIEKRSIMFELGQILGHDHNKSQLPKDTNNY